MHYWFKLGFIFIALGLIRGPLSAAENKSSGAANEPTFWVTVGELLSNGKAYDGKKVAVYAFYFKEAPVSELHGADPRANADPKSWHGKILWIDPVPRKTTGWYVVIGRYVNKPSGTFDRYFGSIESVEQTYAVSGVGSNGQGVSR